MEFQPCELKGLVSEYATSVMPRNHKQIYVLPGSNGVERRIRNSSPVGDDSREKGSGFAWPYEQ